MKKEILNTIGILLGIFLFLKGVILIGLASDPISAPAMVLSATVFGAIAGLIFAHIAGSAFGNSIGKSIFINSGNIKAPPPEFPHIRAKIANREYDEAETELRNLLSKDNGNPHIVGLLAELFIDKTGEIRKAEGLLKAYLSKDERSDDDLKFVMMLADIYTDNDRKELAISLLESESNKKYSKLSIKSISNRLKAIR